MPHIYGVLGARQRLHKFQNLWVPVGHQLSYLESLSRKVLDAPVKTFLLHPVAVASFVTLKQKIREKKKLLLKISRVPILLKH